MINKNYEIQFNKIEKDKFMCINHCSNVISEVINLSLDIHITILFPCGKQNAELM